MLAPGSSALISQLKHADIPCYSILTKNKFSFWKENTELAFSEVHQKGEEGFYYDKMIFSHDVVDLDLFSGVITENAIHTPSEIKEIYQKMQQEFFENEERINSLAL